MLLYFRFLLNMILIFLRRKMIDPHKPLELSFHVLPTDLDLNFHMNNARYSSFMDIIRIQFMFQTSIYRNIKTLKAMPVMGTSYIRFRKSLKPFDRFTIKLQLVYMSPKWIYLDYKFIKNGFVYCHSVDKMGASIPGKGMVTPHKWLPSIPGTEDFPMPPAHILKIMETEDEMRLLIPKN